MSIAIYKIHATTMEYFKYNYTFIYTVGRNTMQEPHYLSYFNCYLLFQLPIKAMLEQSFSARYINSSYNNTQSNKYFNYSIYFKLSLNNTIKLHATFLLILFYLSSFLY